MLRTFYQHIHRYLFIGHGSKNHFTKLNGDSRKLFFSPYAVNTDYFTKLMINQDATKNERQRLNIPDDATVLLFCGKLIEKKDPSTLLRALKNADLQNVHLIIVGEGIQKPELESFAEREISGRVHFVGFKNQSELTPLYLSSDVLILPSAFNETWGLVVNEAMIHGLPAIVSDRVGCRHDLVLDGQTGFVFEHGNVDSLRDVLIKVCNSKPFIKSMGNYAQQHIQRYSPDAAVSGILRAIGF
jgi:glycosyltransferase involved in cell wall biosynthesis